MSHASELLEAIGLRAEGCVNWYELPRCTAPGVYLVEWAAMVPSAPVSSANVTRWLTRVPSLRLDGARPKPGYRHWTGWRAPQ